MTDNELIAKFMSHSTHAIAKSRTIYNDKSDEIETLKMPLILSYDSSWDHLKPVIDKIVILALNDKSGFIILSDYYHEVSDFSIIVSIEPVYRKVVEFIKWYNEQSNY